MHLELESQALVQTETEAALVLIWELFSRKYRIKCEQIWCGSDKTYTQTIINTAAVGVEKENTVYPHTIEHPKNEN